MLYQLHASFNKTEKRGGSIVACSWFILLKHTQGGKHSEKLSSWVYWLTIDSRWASDDLAGAADRNRDRQVRSCQTGVLNRGSMEFQWTMVATWTAGHRQALFRCSFSPNPSPAVPAAPWGHHACQSWNHLSHFQVCMFLSLHHSCGKKKNFMVPD